MTTTQVFEDFLKKKVAEDEKVDWTDRKVRWIKSVDNLYANVNKWLSPYVKESLLKIRYKHLLIEESYVGSYELRQLDILIGNDVVSLIPQGTMVVGGLGRVDMSGPQGKIALFERQWGKWKFIHGNTKKDLWDATDESFKLVIQDLVND